MAKKRKVVVIGAGPGGLCAAMLLSQRGFEVTVLEKRKEVGGRSGSISLGPYTFDVGSTMLMMRFVLDEMFELVGRRAQDFVRFVPLDPMYQLDFGGSFRRLTVYADAARMREELRRFSPGSEAGFAQFLAQEHQRLQKLYPVLQRSYPSLASLLSPTVLAALPHIGIGRSLHRAVGRYFEDEALRLGFSFQAAYLGMSPWTCPGGFGMVPYVEHAWGIDHVQGGIHQVCLALAKAATSFGARVRTGIGVRRVLCDGDRAVGLTLDDGSYLGADAVVINADAACALEALFDEDLSARFSRENLAQLDESCSTYMLYLGLDAQLPIGHHTFFFAEDYRAEMDRLFRTAELGEDFSFYVCNPSASDATMAPEGHTALYVLTLVPNTRAAIDWSVMGPPMRQRVITALERRIGRRIAPHVRAVHHLAPTDWAEHYGVSHGAVFGPSHRIGQLLAFRLPNQLPMHRNVFLTGGGTHPGSGLPTILESARIAARLVCEGHGVPFPAPKPLPEPTTWVRSCEEGGLASPAE